MNEEKKIVFVVGPTAVGKTAFAVLLAKKFDGELVSADSRQVYIGMDIGTGKDSTQKKGQGCPSLKVQYRGKVQTLPSYETDGVHIWMYDVVTPDQPFSVDTYADLSWQVIEDIWKRGRLPIIVGGTGLYISSLLHPIGTSSIPPDEKFRKKAESMSVTDLQNMLSGIAPDVRVNLNESDRNNPRRLVRKIEIARAVPGRVKDTRSFEPFIIGLKAPMTHVYKSIDARVDERIKAGIEKEIRELVGKGYTFSSVLAATLGYKEWKEVFEQKGDVVDAIRRWKFDEHGFARRQMTWFRKMKGIIWFDVTDPSWTEKAVEMIGQWYTIN